MIEDDQVRADQIDQAPPGIDHHGQFRGIAETDVVQDIREGPRHLNHIRREIGFIGRLQKRDRVATDEIGAFAEIAEGHEDLCAPRPPSRGKRGEG